MAKAYNFRISAQKAEFSETDGRQFASIVYGGRDTNYYNEPFTGTLAEVIAEQNRVANAMDKDCYVSVHMANRSDRVPPGFSAKTKGIYKEVPKV